MKKFLMTPRRLAILRSAAESDTNVSLLRGAKTKSGHRYVAHGVPGDSTPQVEALLQAGYLKNMGRAGNSFWAPTAIALTEAGRAALAAAS